MKSKILFIVLLSLSVTLKPALLQAGQRPTTEKKADTTDQKEKFQTQKINMVVRSMKVPDHLFRNGPTILMPSLLNVPNGVLSQTKKRRRNG